MRLTLAPAPRRAQRRLLGEERGVTMIVTLGVLVVTALLLVAVFTAVNGDVHQVRNDLDQRKAYYAAQAGISDYLFHLNQDVNYWTGCNAPAAQLAPTGTTPSDERYEVSPLPANGAAACDPANATATMIESTGPAAGTFRILSTGTSRGVKRAAVATFKRQSFLNYLYYTKTEKGINGSTIQFTSNDTINGPLHSNDSLTICGSPTFGRAGQSPPDVIETPSLSYVCSGTAKVNGTLVNNAPAVNPPPNNAQLQQIAQPAYQFVGATHITLNGASMTVTRSDSSTQTLPFPSNGVVFVSTDPARGCPASAYAPYNSSTHTANDVTYDAYGSGQADNGCGTVFVSGSYTQSLTIGSDQDVVINGSLTTPVDTSGNPTTSALLGLVGENYVRIYHPITGYGAPSNGGACSSGTNGPGSLASPMIYASILAVTTSVIVDNWNCGAALGTLTVHGSIAQVSRGPVGLGSGSTISDGYIKGYYYDGRLQSLAPPNFINPVSAAWHAQRDTECALSPGGPPNTCR